MVRHFHSGAVVFITPNKYFNGYDTGLENYKKRLNVEKSLGLVSIVDNDFLKHTYYKNVYDANLDKPFVDIFLGD